MPAALECKADYLQPVNDITGKPTLIASLSTPQAVSKEFKTFACLFRAIRILQKVNHFTLHTVSFILLWIYDKRI